ncbi:hypothetical protein COCMIDRAFT_32300 [Bipolaris oryzae ATCC 44560]|uniref:Zn(2)-C6 fungal-type domain-containing protein n=1 Tax=Bipolaris oryzae ATCC 44560 TaxID=930090 RepID=W6ZKG8_COCMI|nr:uncharacterized protein COCMIDRAFT_32300 [Bipolaris oryzae ATCC 44560]EUC50478.1 hypothetical protein COCMIDRAFT_32300 [Bipolaris oryzae ATCC 44560]
MNKNFRQILPAAGRVDRGPPVGSTGNQQTRKPRSLACESCRISKIKCTSEKPSCKACLERKTVCRYIETESRQAKRKYEDLRKKQSAHEELFGLIQTLSEQDAFDLFKRVRAGGDVGAILDHVRDGDLLLQMQLVPETRLRYELPYTRDIPALLLKSGSPYLGSLVYEAVSQRALSSKVHGPTNTEPQQSVVPARATQTYQDMYVKPYHAAIFVEPRLENTRISEWTTVCGDEGLMRKLLDAYFTHEYHLWPVFHKDYFLEDLSSVKSLNAKTSSSFASLVNATLAYACCCYKNISNRFRHWEPDGLGYRFFAEARRIWEMLAVSGKNRNLASVQAAMIINSVYNIYGLDKLGSAYGLRGLAIARELKLFDGNARVKSERKRNARNFSAWCLFNIYSHIAWQYLRPPVLVEPPKAALPDPATNSAWYGEIWTRYPLSQTLSPTHHAHYFKAITDFRVIVCELSHASFGNDSPLSAQQAMIFVRRFLSWFKALPTVLEPKNIVLPAHFLMHLDYHITIMAICQPFTSDQWNDKCSPKDIVLNAKRDINVLVRLYYIRHGFKAAHVYLTSPLSKLGFMSLQNLNNSTTPEELELDRSSLLLALEGLREQGRNYYMTRTIYHIMKSQLRPEEARLLQGLETPETSADESPSLVVETQSEWHPRIVDISDVPADEQLSKLATQYLKLDSDVQSDSEVGSSPAPST